MNTNLKPLKENFNKNIDNLKRFGVSRRSSWNNKRRNKSF